ncbi:MAG: ATP-binding cassette domain-containing protein [Rhizomicrobium sp.]
MSRRFSAPLTWLASLLALYLTAPLLAGLYAAGSSGWQNIDSAALVKACGISIASATSAAAIIAAFGIPLGYILARSSGRAMAVLGFLVQLPLALPPLTSGILLLFLIGYASPLGQATGGALTDSFVGIVLAEVFVAAPFLIIAARSAFSEVDPALEGVAASLGRGRLESFWKVSLPIARPSIVSGLLLAWLRAFGEFGATVMVAYHPYSLPVYTFVAFGAQGLPAMLPIILPTLVVALIMLAISGAAFGFFRVSQELKVPSEQVSSVPLPQAGSAAVTRQPTVLNIELHKRLGTFTLDMSWRTQARRLAILGPSGSGKSLSLRLMSGLDQPDGGNVTVDGEDRLLRPPMRRQIGYVPQNHGLFPHLTLLENLLFPRGASKEEARQWLALLGLEGLEQRRPAALSLGQQQRVALARALMRPVDLVLLDEPFSALDAPLRQRLREELRLLQARLDATTILVTHDPTEAALLADEILVLAEGRVLQVGPSRELFRRPASEHVARLLGAQDLAEGLVVGPRHIDVGEGTVVDVGGPDLVVGQRVGWSSPPAHVRLAKDGPYSGTICEVRPVGGAFELRLKVGSNIISLRTGEGEIPPGTTVRFVIDSDFVQVWPLGGGVA